MSLENLMNISSGQRKAGLSEERLSAQVDSLRNMIAFFRVYPDLFVDYIKGPNCTFKFYTYQRVFLRQVMRHRYSYATYPRAYSKSFLSMMALMIKCILYPGSHLFVTTGGKEQAASITIAKIEEICSLIPALNNEINWTRGVSKRSKDDVKYVFKNGSSIDILAARQSSRGQRRTAGLMEECVLIDGDMLNEVIIPTTNVDRLLPDGSRHREEVINQSQTYITTAGFKNTFSYDKLIEILIQSLIEPNEAVVMGGTYEVPVKEGLLPEDFIEQLRLSGTFNEDSFDREYRSIWSGDVENAFFSSDRFDKNRVLLQPEYEYSGRSSKTAYYVIGVDVGRKGCNTEICVVKVTPQVQGTSLKTLVNLYSLEDEHFENQAIAIKKLFYKYKARKVVIDANGLGIGLVDYMVKGNIDPETGELLPDFGVDNDDDGFYKKFRTNDTEYDAMYLVKATAPINTEAHSYVQTQLMNGKIKFLIDENQAKIKLMSTKTGQQMSPDQRAEALKPFVLTTALKAQMMNLIEENEGLNIILKQSSKGIKKDKFSAFEYALFFIKQEDERGKRRRTKDISKMMFFS